MENQEILEDAREEEKDDGSPSVPQTPVADQTEQEEEEEKGEQLEAQQDEQVEDVMNNENENQEINQNDETSGEQQNVESEEPGEDTLNIDGVVNENAVIEVENETLKENIENNGDDLTPQSGTISPTSRHREIQRKKTRPQRRKLDDNMIAEEDGQEEGFNSPRIDPISQNLDESNEMRMDPEIIKPTTPDRMRGVEEEHEEIIEEQELKLTREEIIARYHAALEERDRNQNLNNQLHHKLADYFRRKKNDDSQNQQNFEKSTSQDQDQRYNKYLANIEELHKEMEKQKDIFDYEKYELKTKCENKQEIVQEERGKFLKLKRDTALKSVSGHTGKAVTNKDVEPYFQKESQKEQEVIQVRLENIKLKNQLKKRENQLKEKEELGEGLHLIDFEQLKIENQTYNEKIEERNEELMKLKKKINNTVQILTHVKEKLKFVNAENEKEKESLAYYDDDVKRKRDILNRIKQSRDSLRVDNNRLKQNSGLLGNTTLLRDFEESVDENERLKLKIEQLKRKHAELILNSKGLKKKISQVKSNEK